MAGRSKIGGYTRRPEIDVALAAGVPNTVIAGRHPFSRFAVARYRATPIAEQRDYWRALRRLCVERGINRHSIFEGTSS